MTETLAEKLMKAASHVPKTYLVKISGKPEESALRSFVREFRFHLAMASDE
jgi:16S rRNA U516 pseudouridylate synthase RsuA-like enzyme